MSALADGNGLVRLESKHSTLITTQRLEALLNKAGVRIFARIEFAADAKAAGLEMHPETLLIFGNPKAGTPLMLEQPSVGIDLPLKALLWEDADGHSWLAYNDPGYIVRRHGVRAALANNLAAVIPLLERACQVENEIAPK
jgi:uncharacterized protein (DUF302 family)